MNALKTTSALADIFFYAIFAKKRKTRMESQKVTPLKIYKASAGSGKTFTLAVEYISLLVADPTAYQNILAVTFTNKATAEMKQRILSTLYGIANKLKSADKYIESLPKMPTEELRKRCSTALSNIIHDYSRFHIETIDSFFQSIVKEIASELELPINMKVELDEAEVLSEAVDNIIENLREDSNEFRCIIDFIEEKIKIGRSWQINDTVKEFGRNIFKENYLVYGEEMRREITNYSTIFQYRQQLTEYIEEQKRNLKEQAQSMLTTYTEIGMNEKNGTKSIVTFLEKVRDGKIREPQGNSDGTFSASIRTHIYEADKWFKKTAPKRANLEPMVVALLIPGLEKLFNTYHDLLSDLHSTRAVFQYIYSLMLINEISLKVKTLNEEKSRFLLSETANFLRNVINDQDIPFIYEKTGSVIQHIMIDEFQDTSTLQWTNFKPLILNSLAAEGSCLIVGDVKQSIYRFRNSDWQILNNIETDRDLYSHIQEIPACYNYRSAWRVVEFNNQLFEKATQILQEYCPALSTAYSNVAQTPKKKEETGYVRVENILNKMTLEHIQLSVKELIENGVSVNDITILIRYNYEVAEISDYFNEHQDVLAVKIVSDDAFRLDASPAINIIIYALRALAVQDDRLHLASLAYYYQTTVLENKEMEDSISIPFLCETAADIDSYLPQLFNQHARRELTFKALPELVEDIYHIFQLEKLTEQDAYLFFFNDMVESFGEEHMSDIDTFLEAWDEDLCSKTIPNGAADGVRIMTIHKSKGLEFHTVIIPSCTWTIKPKGDWVMWCQPQKAPYNKMPLLPISVQKATDESIFAEDRREEELRTLVDNINLLYVAFTRAKQNLIILTNNKKDEEIKPEDLIETAQALLLKAMPDCMEITTEEIESEEDIDVVQSAAKEEGEEEEIEGKEEKKPIITIYQYGSIVPSEVQKASDTERNVMECDYSPLTASFTSHPSVAEFRQSYESDLFITENSPNLKVQQHADRIRLISMGNLYHSIFEHIHTCSDIPHAVQLLQSKGCFGSLMDSKEAQERVERLVDSVATTHPEWFSSEWAVLNERDILFLKDGILTTKRPDRVIVKEDAAIVIDYKTAQNAVERKNDGTLAAPSENVNQIRDYKERLLQMGYRQVDAYLWYIMDEIIIPV